MTQCTEQEVQRMLPLVSTQRCEQALRYKHALGQFCCLKSWLMLQEMLADEQKETAEEWKYNEHGKPYLENGPYFSISHCKEGIAVVVDDKPIGIDIEAFRIASSDLIERTMNEEERLAIHRLGNNHFTRLWTQKEAVAKAEGTGIISFEQLQGMLKTKSWSVESFVKDKYIYSIATWKIM